MDMYLITVDELKNLLKNKSNKIYLIDVREKYEYVCNSIGGAVNIPADEIYEIENGNYRILNKIYNIKSYGFDIIVYCKSGIRSMRCVKILRKHGIECLSLHGGTDKYGI